MVRRNPALGFGLWCHCAAALGNPNLAESFTCYGTALRAKRSAEMSFSGHSLRQLRGLAEMDARRPTPQWAQINGSKSMGPNQ
jgi:hypothetical protein